MIQLKNTIFIICMAYAAISSANLINLEIQNNTISINLKNSYISSSHNDLVANVSPLLVIKFKDKPSQSLAIFSIKNLSNKSFSPLDLDQTILSLKNGNCSNKNLCTSNENGSNIKVLIKGDATYIGNVLDSSKAYSVMSQVNNGDKVSLVISTLTRVGDIPILIQLSGKYSSYGDIESIQNTSNNVVNKILNSKVRKISGNLKKEANVKKIIRIPEVAFNNKKSIDTIQPIDFHKLHALLGKPQSLNYLINYYKEHSNYLKLIPWLEKSSQLGSNKSSWELFKLFNTDGNNINKDIAIANHWLKVAFKQGNIEAIHEIGLNFIYGIDAIKDEELGFKLVKRSAISGHYASQSYLGILFLKGIGTEKNKKKAWEWFEIADENNSAYAYQMLKISVANNGEIHPYYTEYADFWTWYEKGALAGVPIAQYEFGAHEEGRVTTIVRRTYGPGSKEYYKQMSIALEWIEKAAKQGNSNATNHLRDKISNLEKNYESGKYPRIAAMELAIMHFKGLGVQKNRDKADIWIEKSGYAKPFFGKSFLDSFED